MTSPYELIVYKPVGVRMIRNCSQCLFFDPDSHNTNGTLHTRFVLRHRVSGIIVEVDTLYDEYQNHKKEYKP